MSVIFIEVQERFLSLFPLKHPLKNLLLFSFTMGFSQFSRLSVLALAFVSPALACVSFSANINNGWSLLFPNQGCMLDRLLTWCKDNGRFNAALTDNGALTCVQDNVWIGDITNNRAIIYLSCIDGYGAHLITTGEGPATVYYNYGSYSGSFGTVESDYSTGGSHGHYWTADVWGC